MEQENQESLDLYEKSKENELKVEEIKLSEELSKSLRDYEDSLRVENIDELNNLKHSTNEEIDIKKHNYHKSIDSNA